MSNYNEKVFTEQIYILRDFLFHYASFREFTKSFDKLSKLDSTELWVYTINAHYYQAINLWCMVFGTEKNETHWRKLGVDKELKPIIINELEITGEFYDKYWKDITEWRNLYSAHRVPGFLEATPDLKYARRIVFLFEEWVANNIDDVIAFSLEDDEKEFIEHTNRTLKSILETR